MMSLIYVICNVCISGLSVKAIRSAARGKGNWVKTATIGSCQINPLGMYNSSFSTSFQIFSVGFNVDSIGFSW